MGTNSWNRWKIAYFRRESKWIVPRENPVLYGEKVFSDGKETSRDPANALVDVLGFFLLVS